MIVHANCVKFPLAYMNMFSNENIYVTPAQYYITRSLK